MLHPFHCCNFTLIDFSDKWEETRIRRALPETILRMWMVIEPTRAISRTPKVGLILDSTNTLIMPIIATLVNLLYFHNQYLGAYSRMSPLPVGIYRSRKVWPWKRTVLSLHQWQKKIQTTKRRDVSLSEDDHSFTVFLIFYCARVLLNIAVIWTTCVVVGFWFRLLLLLLLGNWRRLQSWTEWMTNKKGRLQSWTEEMQNKRRRIQSCTKQMPNRQTKSKGWRKQFYKIG